MVQNTEKVMGILLFLNSDFFNCRSEEKHQQFTLYFNCEILKQSLKQISMILSLHIKIPRVCMYTPPPLPQFKLVISGFFLLLRFARYSLPIKIFFLQTSNVIELLNIKL